MRNSRARPSDSRSPRFDVTSACNSSRMTRLSEPNRYGASADASSSASCSGVVSRMSRRIAALALALRGRRVAGARLDADRQPHLRNRRFEIARDVDGERLERRDVERVQPAVAAHVAAEWRSALLLLPSLGGGDGGGGGAGRAARPERPAPPSPTGGGRTALNSTRLGRKPASVLPPPVGAISSTERPACAFARSSSWCARGVQPRLANQRERSGRIAARSRTVAPELTAGCMAVEGSAITTTLSTGTPFSLRTEAEARCAGVRPAAFSTPRK